MSESSPTPVPAAAPPDVGGRWPIEHVVALAPSASAASAARQAAVPSAWSSVGCDTEALWGVFAGTSAEPYETAVELGGPAFRCSCPSRVRPCKHALGLLIMWALGQVAGGARPVSVGLWLASRAARPAPELPNGRPARGADPEVEAPPGSTRARSRPETENGTPSLPPARPPDHRAAERAARVAGGLAELDRWLADCVRSGLTAPALARYDSWDTVAARLVDAQAPALANRMRRIGGLVGVGPSWHEQVLGELGMVHLITEAGRRLPALDEDLADSVRTAIGWTIRQADVLDRPPETDRWHVLGRSDTLEDRIVVRRLWLRGEQSGAWALSLSFAAYGQSLDDRFAVGTAVRADLHRYPGRNEVRCGFGHVFGEPEPIGPTVRSASLAGACDEVGTALSGVPWLERWPVTVAAAPTLHQGAWLLADHTGSLPIAGLPAEWPTLVAVSGGHPVTLTAEWTPGGLVPLAAHRAEGALDLGPRGGFQERRPTRRSA